MALASPPTYNPNQPVTYQQSLERARADWFKQQGLTVAQLKAAYDDAAVSLATRIQQLPSTAPASAWNMQALQNIIEDRAAHLHQQTLDAMHAGVRASTFFAGQSVIDGAGKVIADTFGAEAIDALVRDVGDRAATQYLTRTTHGVTLSDRVWNTNAEWRSAVQKLVSDAIISGQSAKDLSKSLTQYLQPGVNLPYKEATAKRLKVPKDTSMPAMRLARTELNNAFHEGTIAQHGAAPSYLGIKWRLSGSHPMPDQCNEYADHNGSGFFPKGEEPTKPHPHCFCTALPVHEDPDAWASKLEQWLENPASQPGIEDWYAKRMEPVLDVNVAAMKAQGPGGPLLGGYTKGQKVIANVSGTEYVATVIGEHASKGVLTLRLDEGQGVASKKIWRSPSTLKPYGGPAISAPAPSAGPPLQEKINAAVDTLEKRGVKVELGSGGDWIPQPSEDMLATLQAMDRALDLYAEHGIVVGTWFENLDGQQFQWGKHIRLIDHPTSTTGQYATAYGSHIEVNIAFRQEMIAGRKEAQAEFEHGGHTIPTWAGQEQIEYDVPTIVHELAHNIHNAQSIKQATLTAKVFSDTSGLEFPSIYGQENDLEMFAEAATRIILKQKWGGPIEPYVKLRLDEFAALSNGTAIGIHFDPDAAVIGAPDGPWPGKIGKVLSGYENSSGAKVFKVEWQDGTTNVMHAKQIVDYVPPTVTPAHGVGEGILIDAGSPHAGKTGTVLGTKVQGANSDLYYEVQLSEGGFVMVAAGHVLKLPTRPPIDGLYYPGQKVRMKASGIEVEVVSFNAAAGALYLQTGGKTVGPFPKTSVEHVGDVIKVGKWVKVDLQQVPEIHGQVGEVTKISALGEVTIKVKSPDGSYYEADFPPLDTFHLGLAPDPVQTMPGVAPYVGAQVKLNHKTPGAGFLWEDGIGTVEAINYGVHGTTIMVKLPNLIVAVPVDIDLVKLEVVVGSPPPPAPPPSAPPPVPGHGWKVGDAVEWHDPYSGQNKSGLVVDVSPTAVEIKPKGQTFGTTVFDNPTLIGSLTKPAAAEPPALFNPGTKVISSTGPYAGEEGTVAYVTGQGQVAVAYAGGAHVLSDGTFLSAVAPKGVVDVTQKGTIVSTDYQGQVIQAVVSAFNQGKNVLVLKPMGAYPGVPPKFTKAPTKVTAMQPPAAQTAAAVANAAAGVPTPPPTGKVNTAKSGDTVVVNLPGHVLHGEEVKLYGDILASDSGDKLVNVITPSGTIKGLFKAELVHPGTPVAATASIASAPAQNVTKPAAIAAGDHVVIQQGPYAGQGVTVTTVAASGGLFQGTLDSGITKTFFPSHLEPPGGAAPLPSAQPATPPPAPQTPTPPPPGAHVPPVVGEDAIVTNPSSPHHGSTVHVEMLTPSGNAMITLPDGSKIVVKATALSKAPTATTTQPTPVVKVTDKGAVVNTDYKGHPATAVVTFYNQPKGVLQLKLISGGPPGAPAKFTKSPAKVSLSGMPATGVTPTVTHTAPTTPVPTTTTTTTPTTTPQAPAAPKPILGPTDYATFDPPPGFIAQLEGNPNAKELQHVFKVGSANSSKFSIFDDPSGAHWLHKKQDEWVNQLDAATAGLAEEMGLPTASSKTYIGVVNGFRGSVQRMFGSASSGTRRFAFGEDQATPGKSKRMDPERAKPQMIADLQKHQVFDWLIGNHDTHKDNFVKVAGTSGAVMAIDKGQSFKFYGKDRLSEDYDPNDNEGFNGGSVYNVMNKAWRDGKAIQGFADLSTNSYEAQQLRAHIEKLQAFDDKRLKALLRPYAQEAAKTGKLASFNAHGKEANKPSAAFANDVEGFLDAVVARKHALMTDFTEFHQKLHDVRYPPAPPPPPLPANLQSVLHGDKGADGAVKFTTSTDGRAFGNKHWTGVSVIGAKQALSDYQGSDYVAWNAGLRGLRTLSAENIKRTNQVDAVMNRKKVPEDVMVVRGDGTSGDPWLKSVGQTVDTLVGTIQTQKGYWSTSLDAKGAFGHKPYALHIRVPAGTPAYFMDLLHDIGERELLLGRGLRYYIHDYSPPNANADGKHHVYIEILPPHLQTVDPV